MGQHEAGLGLGALVGIHDEQGAVGHVEHALHLAAEVGMARRVDDVDLHALVVDGNVLGKDGNAALAFLVVGVQHALFHLLIVAEHVRRPQQAVHQGGLAVVNMGDDGNVADVLLLHESSFLFGLGPRNYSALQRVSMMIGADGAGKPSAVRAVTRPAEPRIPYVPRLASQGARSGCSGCAGR